MPATPDPDVPGDVARASHAAGIPAEHGMRLVDEFFLVHELSHIYADAYGITSQSNVVREFTADFLGVAYHAQVPLEARDRLFNDAWLTATNWASGQKPRNTSLDDFERMLIGVDNYGWYHAQFVKRGTGPCLRGGCQGGVPARDAASVRGRHARAAGEDQSRLHRMGRASEGSAVEHRTSDGPVNSSHAPRPIAAGL